MTSVDVGDAIELVFTTAVDADVTVSWFDPDQTVVLDQVPVTESPAGKFAYTFLPTAPGTWTALFTASGTATAVERLYVRAAAVTGPPPLAVLGDVAKQYGTLTAAQEGLTNALLRAASSLVRSRFPAVDDLIAAGRLDPDVVALGVTNMVLRVLRNPNGLRSETIGPFSRTFDIDGAAGLLTVTDGDAGMFCPPVVLDSVAAYGIGTVMMRAGLAPPPSGVWYGRH